MKRILLIRHAESFANAGLATESPENIPLTEKGLQQALALAETLDIEPELIIISTYQRTHETAKPFREKAAHVPVEIWDMIHEFSYLNKENHKNSTTEMRRPHVEKYWQQNDPTYCEDNAESFQDFLNRVQSFLAQVRNRPEKTICVFSHGLFIFAARLILEMKDLPTVDELKVFMKDFYERARVEGPANTAVLEIQFEMQEM